MKILHPIAPWEGSKFFAPPNWPLSKVVATKRPASLGEREIEVEGGDGICAEVNAALSKAFDEGSERRNV